MTTLSSVEEVPAFFMVIPDIAAPGEAAIGLPAVAPRITPQEELPQS